MNEKQKTWKVVLPRLANPNQDLFHVKYDHIVRHDCDYSFSILKENNLIKKVDFAQNVKPFVLPNFKYGAYTIVQGAFADLKDVTLVITGNAPIKICHNAFVDGAEVKLILPRDMALFHVRDKAELNGEIWAVDFPVVAKNNFHLSGDNFSMSKVDEMDGKLPFKISVDTGKQYNRTTRTVEEVKEIAKTNQRIEKIR